MESKSRYASSRSDARIRARNNCPPPSAGVRIIRKPTKARALRKPRSTFARRAAYRARGIARRLLPRNFAPLQIGPTRARPNPSEHYAKPGNIKADARRVSGPRLIIIELRKCEAAAWVCSGLLFRRIGILSSLAANSGERIRSRAQSHDYASLGK